MCRIYCTPLIDKLILTPQGKISKTRQTTKQDNTRKLKTTKIKKNKHQESSRRARSGSIFDELRVFGNALNKILSRVFVFDISFQSKLKLGEKGEMKS